MHTPWIDPDIREAIACRNADDSTPLAARIADFELLLDLGSRGARQLAAAEAATRSAVVSDTSPPPADSPLRP